MIFLLTICFACLAPTVQIGLSSEKILDVPPEAKTFAAIASYLKQNNGIAATFDADSEVKEEEALLAIAMSRPKFVLTGCHWSAQIANLETGKLEQAFKGHKNWVLSAVFSPDGTHVLTASRDNTAKIFDRKTGQLLQTLKYHTKKMNSAVFSPDPEGTLVLTASNDNTAKIFNRKTNTLLQTLFHTREVTYAVFSPTGTLVLTASADRTAKIFDQKHGTLLKTFEGHTDLVKSAVFNPEGTHVLTASHDNTAKIFDLTTNEVQTFEGHTLRVQSAVFSPDGTRVLTASDDGTAKIFDRKTGEILQTIRSGGLDSAVFSPDGNFILTTSLMETKIYNLESGSVEEMKGRHLNRAIFGVEQYYLYKLVKNHASNF